jgi:hypothetical protein
MSKHEPSGHFKPSPYSYVSAHNCIGEVRPCGRGYFAVAVIAGFPIWLGTYIDRAEACRAIVDAHGGADA